MCSSRPDRRQGTREAVRLHHKVLYRHCDECDECDECDGDRREPVGLRCPLMPEKLPRMMTTIGLDGAIPITTADITAAEQALGFALPPALVAFCLAENGGMPTRCWLIDEVRDLEYWINWFIPIEPAEAMMSGGLVAVYRQLVSEGLLPTGSLPFARDAGGNFFLLDRDDRRVWFMPMDEWHHAETAGQNWARSGRTVADSLAAFLKALSAEPPRWAAE